MPDLLPLCRLLLQQDLEKTIFSRSSTKPFRSLKLSGMFFDETSKCYFEDQAHFEQAQKLWKFACPVCDKECEHPLASLSNLKKHLKTHHMYYWCVRGPNSLATGATCVRWPLLLTSSLYLVAAICACSTGRSS
jgi:hypothetical protein